ncbi:MAG: class I adenylate-forming enzyme family protein [Candidatus Xenobia bacterium]
MTTLSLEIPTFPYPQLLDRSVERHPDKDALRFQGGRLTYAELQQQTWRMARVLERHGVQPGDRVAISLYNTPHYVIAFYGILRLGAVVVPLNASYRSAEALHILHDSGTRLLIAGERMAAQVKDSGVALLLESQLAQEIAAMSAAPWPGQELDVAETLAVLQYSSGTTGQPRGVMLTHRNLLASHLQYAQAGQVTEQDVSLLFVPFVHVYGTMLMGGGLAAGATEVLMERYALQESLEQVHRYGVTLYYCTTAVVIDLVQSPLTRNYNLSTLRYINSGGAPLPPDIRRKARHELGIAIANGYGMTEAPIVGHLVPGEERKIVDAENPQRECAVGECGEIWVRGPQVMKGYWNDPQGTSDVLRDGWLRTGDIGCIDERGRLLITARQKEMIKYKGFAVSPTELEGLLLAHPAVADCAVVGMPQPDGNELPKAFVVARNGGSIDEAVAWVNDQVAEYKKIRQVERVPSIPRNDAGKILKRVLKAGGGNGVSA